MECRLPGVGSAVVSSHFFLLLLFPPTSRGGDLVADLNAAEGIGRRSQRRCSAAEWTGERLEKAAAAGGQGRHSMRPLVVVASSSLVVGSRQLRSSRNKSALWPQERRTKLQPMFGDVRQPSGLTGQGGHFLIHAQLDKRPSVQRASEGPRDDDLTLSRPAHGHGPSAPRFRQLASGSCPQMIRDQPTARLR